MSKKVQAPKIVHGRDVRKLLLYGLVLAVVAAVVGGMGYQYGLTRPEASGASLRAVQRELVAQLDQAEDKNKALRTRLGAMQRSMQIDRQAMAEVRGQIKALQDKNMVLQEELAFYRSIVSPEKGRKGLRIQNFKLHGRTSSRRYRYEIVLTQALNNDRYTKGVTRFSVQGAQGKYAKDLPLEMLSTEERKEHAFRFRYFQNLKGVIELPEGFVPERIIVEAVPAGKKQKRLERSFAWPDLS